MFYSHVVKQCFIELVAELCSSVRNDNIWTAVPGEYYVQLFSYCCGLLVWYWNIFNPFCEEALNTKDIHESLCFRQLH